VADGITLYGRKTSVNVQKAMWALEELGAPYEQIELGLNFGGLDTPDYLVMNPNALVPTLKHGDLTLWESHAIVRYIAATYGSGSLWPADPKERALCDQWTDWTAMRFQPAWLGVFVLAARTKPDHRDPAAIAKAVEAANACFRILDGQLQTTPYLTGDDLTYADIVTGAALHRWYDMDIERTPFAGVEAWRARLLKRPAYIKTVCTNYDVLKNTVPA
jgi:glutathione S-transferase